MEIAYPRIPETGSGASGCPSATVKGKALLPIHSGAGRGVDGAGAGVVVAQL